MRASFAIAAAAAAAAAAGLGGRAEACPPIVELEGDEHLVREIDDLLRARGIEDDAASCPGLRARLDRRGDAIAVEVIGPGGARIVRVVGELSTAATVIESFARADVGAPLLVRREAPVAAPVVVPRGARRFADGPDGAPAISQRHATTRGVQLFASIETSIGSDRTNWMGLQLGTCISLGPICAAARLREAKVVAGDGVWKTGELEREATELLVGIDIPLALGRMTLSPGFAAGLGVIRTETAAGAMQEREPEGSAGLRADVHATLTVPLGRRLAIDLSVAADMTQATRVRWTSDMAMPDEPLVLFRFGAGLRYGGM